MSAQDVALPKGSIVLVTGATGYIASHIVHNFLQLGYRVRGTVRSSEKASQTTKLYSSLVPNGHYEPAIVADMAEDNAFDEAIKGVDAVVHCASVLTFSPDPNKVIPETIAGAISVLKSAAKEKSVKRFVYTSSSTAATLPKPGQKFKIDKDLWDDQAVEIAWAPPPYTAERAYPVYGASKTEAERAVWKFVQEQKPAFVVNCVLPDANMGKILSSPAITGTWVPTVYKGGVDSVKAFPPQWMVDVNDNARIHVAATIDKSLANERIFAFGHPFNWNDIIDACQKVRPGWQAPKHIPGQERDLSEPDNELGAELLRKWFGQDGYRSLEETVRENLEGEA